MTTKSWIAIKRGLVTDPKHRIALGESVWLYFHIIDRANWDTGRVLDWKDKDESDSMEMKIATLRDQRRKLEQLGYITVNQKQHNMEVIVHKWHNPRHFEEGPINVKDQGEVITEPSDDEGLTQGDTQGDTQGVAVPFVNSVSSSNQRSKNQRSKFAAFWPRTQDSAAPIILPADQSEPERNYFWEGAFQLVYGQPYTKTSKISKADSGKLGKLVKAIREVDLPAESIPLIWRWWQRYDWRALQAKRLRQPVPRPTITQAIEVISVAAVWIRGGMLDELPGQEDHHEQPAIAVTGRQADIADEINARAHGTTVEYERAQRRQPAALPALQ